MNGGSFLTAFTGLFAGGLLSFGLLSFGLLAGSATSLPQATSVLNAERATSVEPTHVLAPIAPVNSAHPPPKPAPWANVLTAVIETEMAPFPDGEIGVYIHDLERSEGLSYHDKKPRYLASGVKLLYMVELYRQREAGVLRFDDDVLYTWNDVRDGAPALNKLARGRRYPVSELLLYMLRDSDNAAADLLGRKIGVRHVRRGLLRDGFYGIGPVVSLMDVRRDVYRRLDPRADRMTAVQVRDVRWRNGFHPRLDLLKKHIGEPYGTYNHADLDVAYRDYYTLRRNSAPMRTMGALLESMWKRELVSEQASNEMLARLGDVWSSGHRIRGAIPPARQVLHKTGTQHRRISDLAIVILQDGRPLIMAMAVEGIRREQAEPIMFRVAQSAFELAERDVVRTARFSR